MADIVCQCGHTKNVHDYNEQYNDYMCLIKGKNTMIEDCPCFNYIPDNLLHIEMLAKKRKLI
jgi:hypothetical protein